MNKKKFFNILFRIFLVFFVIFFIIFSPIISYSAGDDLKYIYSVFLGTKSEYNGMIEVWNIDSFESGIASKTSYLESIGKKFQKSNKGVYVFVRNMTENECLNSLNSGVFPDLISCSYGLSKKIQQYIVPFDNPNSNIYKNFLDAGKIGKNIYGLAWCVGFYTLISTKTKLEKAGLFSDDVKLNEIAFSASYENKIGKKTKNSVSIAFGTNNYLMPKKALYAYNNVRSIQLENENNQLQLKSQYSAYCSFLSNDATILLGTQRDICRMENRVKQQKVSDVIYLPLTNWTDLIQFSFIIKNDNGLRKKYAEKFANFLTETRNQEMLENIGMFSVLQINSSFENSVMRNIALENIGICEANNVFDTTG